MDHLHITLVQPDIIWKDAKNNLARYSDMLKDLQGKTDLVLLPEMFQTGFCTDPEDIAETMTGESIRWMKRTAESLQCAISGSLIVRENRRFFNRLVFIDQYENMTWYDKRHLFTMEGEGAKFTPGMQRLIVPLKGWQINFQICYDLRFPVWARNQDDYDVLIYLANWPAARRDVWITLLKARAIENQAYTIGLNRIGTDGNNIAYTGDSIIYTPKGEILAKPEPSHEVVETYSLSWKELVQFREKFAVWKDRDKFSIVV